MSRLAEALKDIKTAQDLISKQNAVIKQSNNFIEQTLNENKDLDNFLRNKIWEGLSEKEKSLAIEKREKREKEAKRIMPRKHNDENTLYDFDDNCSYSCSISVEECDNSFDPLNDKYSIIGFDIKDDKIRIKVECLGMRQYIGAFNWIVPNTFTTPYIDIKELEKYENNNIKF